MKQDFSSPQDAETHLQAVLASSCEVQPSVRPVQFENFNRLLVECCSMKGIYVSQDFGPLLISAMEYLQKTGRSNIFYNLARGVGTMREDGSDSRFPVKRMPFGLVEYTAKFFSSDNFQQVLVCKGSLNFTLSVEIRLEDVLRTTGHGKSPCIFYLVLNGAIFSMGQCGEYIQLSKDVLSLSLNQTPWRYALCSFQGSQPIAESLVHVEFYNTL